MSFFEKNANPLAVATLLLSATMGSANAHEQLHEPHFSAGLKPPTTSEIKDFPVEVLIHHEQFQGLSDEQQVKTLKLFNALPMSARRHLVTLLERTLPEGETSALLDTDFKGGTLLDTLQRSAEQPMHPALEANRDHHLTTFLSELAEPGELDQRGRGVCGTSIVCFLYTQYPAEAARLTSALLSPEGEVELLTDGEVLRRAPYWDEPYDRPYQTETEMLITTGLMDVANGAQEIYCARCDKSFDPVSGDVTRGLSSVEQQHLWNVLFGTDQTQILRVSDAPQEDHEENEYSRDEVFQALLDRADDSVISLAIIWKRDRMAEDWSSVMHGSLSPETDDAEVHLYNNDALDVVQKDSGHVVLLDSIEDGVARFRNMQRGETLWPKGHVFEEPERTLVDPVQNIQEMPLDRLKRRLSGIIVLKKSELPNPSEVTD